jgi:DNA-directed RNA polymerase specialized sigma24 family protein
VPDDQAVGVLRVVNIEDIRSEYAQETIGPRILAEVERAVRSATTRLPPNAYAEVPEGHAGGWSEHNVENLVQDVVLVQLLQQGQLEYAIANAPSLRAFRSLMYRCVARQVRARRRRTAVDSLVLRAREVLEKPPYSSDAEGRRTTYALGGRHGSEGADEQKIYRAAQMVAALPRTHRHSRTGVPLLLDTDGLHAALSTIAVQLASGFTLDDVRRVFELAFTEHALSTLLPSYDSSYDDWEDPAKMPATTSTALDSAVLNEIELALCNDLDNEQRMILRLKAAEVSDDEVAQQIGVSRPTAAKRKAAMQAVLRKHLGGLEDDMQEAVLDRVLVRLAVEDREANA